MQSGLGGLVWFFRECKGQSRLHWEQRRRALGAPAKRQSYALHWRREVQLIRWCALSFSTVMALAPSQWVAAQERWPAAYSSRIYYYSTDPTPIEVTVRRLGNPDLSQRAMLRIPRAYVVFADGYRPHETPTLPDAIETGTLGVALTYPDGMALSVHAAKLQAERQMGRTAADSALRSQQYSARLHYIRPGVPWEDRARGRIEKTGERVGTFDGLEHFRKPRRDWYRGRPGGDQFVSIDCAPAQEALPVHFCRTVMRISRDLVADVHFVDFRLHGGRVFANERALAFRKSICRFVLSPCEVDARSLR